MLFHLNNSEQESGCSVFTDQPISLAMAYVPTQKWEDLYESSLGLRAEPFSPNWISHSSERRLCQMAQNSTRQTLMKRVQMYEFALVEANLFLDSHPDDQEALKYYSKYAGLLQKPRRRMKSSSAP